MARQTLAISILCLLSLTALSAQPTLPDPGGMTDEPFTEISGSDYGPRNFDKRTDRDSNPHKGIDYKIRDNIKGRAVEGGAVTNVQIDKKNPTASYISIGGVWSYIHIATNTLGCQIYAPGTAGVDEQGDPMPASNVVVLREEKNGVWRTTTVLGAEVGSFKDPKTPDVKSVTTYVSSRSWVFLAHPNQQHLHLQYRQGAENPLKYVLHSDSNTPVAVLWPKFKRIGLDGQASDFSDDIIFNTFQSLILQAGVDVTGDKDLDKVEISYLMEGDFSSATLNGWAYEPATTSGSIKSTWAPAGKIHISSMVPIASASEEGVYPAKNVVSLDFFKYKWDTRALNAPATGFLSAPLNSMAKYPDGRYMIQMGAIDITGHTVSTDSRPPDIGYSSSVGNTIL